MERLSFELSQALKKHPSLSVDLLVPSWSVQSSLLRQRIYSVFFALAVIPRALNRARHADVVYLGDPVLSIVGWLIQRVYKKRIAITVHGLDVTYPNTIYQWYLSVFFRTFSVYLPISQHARALLDGKNVSGSVVVLPPGIHDRYFDATITKEQMQPVVPQIADLQSKQIMLTSGRLVKRKGHEWFVRYVLPKLPNHLVYVIAGDGPEKQAITQATRETGQEHRVVLLGRVSDADLKILYNSADVFIQPNIKVLGDAEGFGIVLLEAASCTVPVLASNLEGIADAIVDGKNGRLLPAENVDAWVKAVIDTVQHNERQAAARDFTLQTFSWAAIVERFYRAVL